MSGYVILWWIIVGVIAGFLAKAVVPGEGPVGVLGDLVVGIVGAIIGGFLMSMLGLAAGGGMLWTIVVAFIGAVVLLLILRAITGRRTVY
jgi:uncharacterized membrane protein YeaQ/YmgE (transglycosylase-associated protein family)